MGRYILALDQGTTSSRAILFDGEQRIVSMAQKEFRQFFPREGWVEQDPMEIYASQYAVMTEAIAKSNVIAGDITAVGITNQRETTVVWDKTTGLPVYNAIVWQCRRTADIVEELIKNSCGETIKEATGLLPDAYFSGPKIKWILDHVDGAREKAVRGDLLFGTVDTWLIWKLTNGAVHATDYTNASRTMLFNIHTLKWDETLLGMMDIPHTMLPEVQESACLYGTIPVQGAHIPIAGVAGDQQAALFGQTCFEAGEAKNTYGTGCFLLMHTGNKPVTSRNGLITTLAACIDGNITYALEGSVFTGGAVIQWLRDEMRFFSESGDSEYYARKVPDTGGVYLVPAFTGLGAPYWDMYARGIITGITRATKREHIIRAALEAVAYQSCDLVRAMERDTGCRMSELRVDGGASQNGFLMQFQADLLGIPVRRPGVHETTALGACYLAGLTTGVWSGADALKKLRRYDRSFEPEMDEQSRQALTAGWHKAVGLSRG
ncbi:MAG: glycerol kinase GlpK [Clostridiales bacterium]|nr:glycerol kinase GlpK [Clostridiales bacterium]